MYPYCLKKLLIIKNKTSMKELRRYLNFKHLWSVKSDLPRGKSVHIMCTFYCIEHLKQNCVHKVWWTLAYKWTKWNHILKFHYCTIYHNIKFYSLMIMRFSKKQIFFKKNMIQRNIASINSNSFQIILN